MVTLDTNVLLPVYTFDAALHHDSRYRAPGLSGAPRAR